MKCFLKGINIFINDLFLLLFIVDRSELSTYYLIHIPCIMDSDRMINFRSLVISYAIGHYMSVLYTIYFVIYLF